MTINSAYCRAKSIKTGVYVHGYYCGTIPDSGEHVLWTRKLGSGKIEFCHKKVRMNTIEFQCPIKDKDNKSMYEGDEVEFQNKRFILEFNKKELRWCLSLSGIPVIYMNSDVQLKLIDYHEAGRN